MVPKIFLSNNESVFKPGIGKSGPGQEVLFSTFRTYQLRPWVDETNHHSVTFTESGESL